METRNDHRHPVPKEEEFPFKDSPSHAPAVVDRTKRDEWSEGAVSCLLDSYEAKWVLRNRAKLKGQDWDDVARAVSARPGTGKSPKTATQCKNKVESMKKRYRSESATGNGSRWPLFARLDSLVRCREPTIAVALSERPIDPEPELETEQENPAGGLPAADGPNVAVAQQLPKPNGLVAVSQGECRDSTAKEHTNETHTEMACSAHKSDESSSREDDPQERNKKRKKRREQSDRDFVMKSIRLFADVALKMEQARMEAMKEMETMRAQAEAKRGELELKRTEIIANTQLQIAKLLARKCGGGGDSSSNCGFDGTK